MASNSRLTCPHACCAKGKSSKQTQFRVLGGVNHFSLELYLKKMHSIALRNLTIMVLWCCATIREHLFVIVHLLEELVLERQYSKYATQRMTML